MSSPTAYFSNRAIWPCPVNSVIISKMRPKIKINVDVLRELLTDAKDIKKKKFNIKKDKILQQFYLMKCIKKVMS